MAGLPCNSSPVYPVAMSSTGQLCTGDSPSSFSKGHSFWGCPGASNYSCLLMETFKGEHKRGARVVIFSHWSHLFPGSQDLGFKPVLVLSAAAIHELLTCLVLWVIIESGMVL